MNQKKDKRTFFRGSRQSLDLPLNETKLPSRNAFIFNLFVLESEKESRKDERILIWGFRQSLDLSLNP